MTLSESADLLVNLRRELERAEGHNRELTRRLQHYSDTLFAISQLDHRTVQNAIKLAKQALAS
jgi:hypothetical protein